MWKIIQTCDLIKVEFKLHFFQIFKSKCDKKLYINKSKFSKALLLNLIEKELSFSSFWYFKNFLEKNVLKLNWEHL